MISMKVVEAVWVYICIGDATIRAAEGRLTAPLNTFGERTEESESTTRDLSPVLGLGNPKLFFSKLMTVLPVGFTRCSNIARPSALRD